MVVTGVSKTRNCPHGHWSPYGNLVAHEPGEWAPREGFQVREGLSRPISTPDLLSSVAAVHRATSPWKHSVPTHRLAPSISRSKLIGQHLQVPPCSRDPLEQHAMRRATLFEAQARKLERRLEIFDSERWREKLEASETANAALRERVTELEHALDVAQSRIWHPRQMLSMTGNPQVIGESDNNAHRVVGLRLLVV